MKSAKVALCATLALILLLSSCVTPQDNNKESSDNGTSSEAESTSVGTLENPEESEVCTGRLEGKPIVISLDLMCESAVCGHSSVIVGNDGGVSLPTPTRENYAFAGWFYDKDATREFDPAEVPTGDVTLYAVWKFRPSIYDLMKNPVTIEYIPNGGSLLNLEYLGQAFEDGKMPSSLPVPKLADHDFVGWYVDSELTIPFDGENAVKDNRLFAKWKYKYYMEGMTLPIIAVDVKGGKEISTRSSYFDCTVSVNGGGSDMKNASAAIRGRGNSTWTVFDKKSYRLKFDEKTDLFGMGKEKDYLLIANAFDQSMLRNYTAYTFAGIYGNEFTTECQFVHLYVNGEYYGMYLVTEHTEEGEYRVNIGDGTEGGVDVGYLIEFGGEIDVEDKKFFHLGDVEYEDEIYSWGSAKLAKIKSPDGNVCTKEQRDYISNYLNEVNKAIFTHDFETFSELCDVDSFVDNFILNEILFPGDWGYNFFMYKKPGGKLCIGPLWDYDQSAGNSEHGGMNYDSWNTASNHLWFRALRKTPEFFELARKRYEEKYDVIHTITDVVMDEYNEIVTDLALNYERWDEIGTRHWRSLEELVAFKTQKEHVDQYVGWLQNRLGWLEAESQFNITK